MGFSREDHDRLRLRARALIDDAKRLRAHADQTQAESRLMVDRAVKILREMNIPKREDR
jgi:hypothetical protein